MRGKAFIYRYLKAVGPWNYDVSLQQQKQNPFQSDPAICITYVSSQLYSINKCSVLTLTPFAHMTLLVQTLVFSVLKAHAGVQ